MALQADFISPELNTFMKALITAYSRIPWAMDKAVSDFVSFFIFSHYSTLIKCGYACSDHASWHKAGFPSAFPYEAVTGNDNPNIHSPNDKTSVAGFSWAHSLEFAKIAVAFAYELAM